MKKALITGCHGFVARIVTQAFRNNGYRVVGVCRDFPSESWQQQSDFTTQDLLGILNEIQPDVVFHGAGTASVGSSLVNPNVDFAGSVLCFQRLLEGIRLSGLRPHVIFPSSAAIYGNRGGTLHESSLPDPISPYGFHKWQCEILAKEYAQVYGIPVTVARLFSVFGPEQHKLIVWEIFKQAHQTGHIHLRGTGAEARDYLPAPILAEILVRLPQPETSHVLNIASGKRTRVRELAEIANIFFGGGTIGTSGVPIPGDPINLLADVSMLHTLVTDTPPFVLQDALGDCFRRWTHV